MDASVPARTPHGHYSVLLRRLARVETYAELLSSTPDIVEQLAGMTPPQQASLMAAYARALSRLGVAAHAERRASASRGPRLDWRPLLPKLRELAPKYPRDEDLARALGVRVSQVERARLRYITQPASSSAAQGA